MITFASHRTRVIGAAFLCAAFLLFAQGAFFLVVRAQTASSTPVRGFVTNGTQNASPSSVAGLPVTLFQMGGTGPVTRTVQTDPQGSFSFGDVSLSAQTPYFVQLDYQGIHYFSDIHQGEISTTVPLSLTVFETQVLPANYTVDRAHFILDVAPHTVSGIELLQLKNPTDRAFLLPLPLPRGGSVQFNDPRDEFRVVKNSDGSMSFPVLPTTQEILLGVEVNLGGGNTTLNVETPVTLGQMNVLVAQTAGVQVSSPRLVTGQPFTPPQNPNSTQPPQTYWQLSGTGIAAHSTVPVSIITGGGIDSALLQKVVVMGGGALAAVLLLAYPFIRRRQGHAGAADDARQEILTEMADLDDQWEAGKIGEEEYRAERAALKSELREPQDE